MWNLIKNISFIAAIISIIAYAIVRIVLTMMLAHEFVWADQVFSFALLFGEIFILVHALGYAIDMVTASRAKDIKERAVPELPFPPPPVAILVAARHEPREVLEETFRSLTNLRYPAKTIYFLDDSSDESYRREAEEITAKFDLKLFRRRERHGAKAGIINDCLKTLAEKYVAVFDADQNPAPSFLTPLIPILEAEPKLAFIQTPQFYSNIEESRVARSAAFQQSVFYEYICEAKGSNESMFCCGTNVVFRREALVSVGGMDELVVTEDFATSVRLHMSGWKSLYYNHVGVFGMGPETLAAYFKQQGRWAKGTIGVFRKIIANFLSHPLRLKPGQWWEYFLSGTYYFVGIVFMTLMLCPVAYLLFNVPSFFLHNEIYLSVFVPYFALSMGIFIFTLRERLYRARDLLLAQVLAYITFPVLALSAVTALFGYQGSFGITMKGKGERLPWITLWPQLTFLFLNLIAFVWGLNRFWYERDSSVIINCIWAFYHFCIMMGVFYFNVGVPREEPVRGTAAAT